MDDSAVALPRFCSRYETCGGSLHYAKCWELDVLQDRGVEGKGTLGRDCLILKREDKRDLRIYRACSVISRMRNSCDVALVVTVAQREIISSLDKRNSKAAFVHLRSFERAKALLFKG